MSDFHDILKRHITGGTCLKIVLSRPYPKRGAATQDSEPRARKVVARPIQLRGCDSYQFAMRAGSREIHENLAPDDAARRVQELFGHSFLDCHLFTTTSDYVARIARSGHVKVTTGTPTASSQSQRAQTARPHDREKRRLLRPDEPVPFLVEIGVMTPAGKVRANKQKKFRQINRFLELVDDVIGELPSRDPLRVVDFGCGKSYLTFALHHLLTAVRSRRVEIVGLDRDRHVIDECRRVAGRLDCTGLEFREGHIADYEPATPVDLAVSLHACDTATDDALAKAVLWGCAVILAVPCCQHELAGKLRSPELEPLAAHGILKERMAALATDALRAQILELRGYRTQVLEFIDMEHTAKNVLIRAVRRKSGTDSAGAVPPADLDKQTVSLREFKELLGVQETYLEERLGDGAR